MPPLDRRDFLRQAAFTAAACLAGNTLAQVPGERPPPSREVTVLNPRHRVPVGLIIDDSTCLVNLNRFATPQFAQARGPGSPHEKISWREWPVEIPDSFTVRWKGAATQAPVSLPATNDWNGWRFRPVLALGTFDAAHQIQRVICLGHCAGGGDAIEEVQSSER